MIEREEFIYRLNPFQERIHDALFTNKRIIAIFAGWRSGKTDAVCIEHIIRRQLINNPDVLHVIGANTYSQLIDSTLRVLFQKLDLLNIPHIPAQLPRGGQATRLLIHNGQKWVEFLCKSMEAFDTIAGITAGSIWLDEVWGTEKWTFDLANSRLSDKRSKHLQLVLTSTTDEPTHWLYTDIVAVQNPDIMEIVYGTTYDNQNNLSDGYIESVASTVDKRMFERFILAKWVSISQGKIIYNFSRILHLAELRYDASLPVLFSCDFNINPMCWSIWQQHGNELWCIDELMITQRADTEMAARELKMRYDDTFDFICFGDASGQSGSTRGKYSDYEIIQQVFKDRHITFRIPAGNPSVRDSANAVNARLLNAKGEVNLYFDAEKTKNVYLSVENTMYRPGTLEKDDSCDKQVESIYTTHFSDTVRYIVNSLYPISSNQARGRIS